MSDLLLLSFLSARAIAAGVITNCFKLERLSLSSTHFCFFKIWRFAVEAISELDTDFTDANGDVTDAVVVVTLVVM